MKILVKFGGSLLEEKSSRQRLATELVELNRPELHTVVVHGGGKQMTQFLKERGVESNFVGGLRVSTPEVIDAVLKIFTGTVNQGLVASMVAAGIQAVGLSGIDACLVEAEQMDPALGAVGRPVQCNAKLLNTLIAGGFLPVVACVASDRQGNIYNVNADQMAVACAVGFQADKLFFLTDVEGVRDASGKIIPEMTIADGEKLIADGVARGGMEAKLKSAHHALREGSREVVVAPGAEPGAIARLLAGESLGTRLVR